MVRIVNFSVKASDVSHPHKMNHGVSEEHQVHTSASDTLIILLQVHLESFFKTFKRWDLKKEHNTIVKFDKTRKLLCEVSVTRIYRRSSVKNSTTLIFETLALFYMQT